MGLVGSALVSCILKCGQQVDTSSRIRTVATEAISLKADAMVKEK